MPRRKSDPDGEGHPASPTEGTTRQPDDSSTPAEAEAPAGDPLAEGSAPIDPAPVEASGSEPASDRAATDPDPTLEPMPAAPPPLTEPLTEDLSPPHDTTHDERHEKEAGRSFAARALTALLLLLAGAGLGIWAAPRLAPIAAWMTPGASDAEARIDALEASVDQRIAAAESRIAALPAGDDLDARIDAAVTQATAQTSDEVTALRSQVEGQDTADMRQRLDSLASSLEGQAAELSTLKDQLDGGAAASSTLTDETVARIDVYRAELDGLRAEVTALGNQTSALSSRIDEVAATADRSIETAQAQVATIEADATDALGAAQTASDLALLRAALAAGQPFPDVAERIGAATEAPLPEGIAAAAATGAPTVTVLRESFPEAAHAAIRASIIASAGEGIVARAGAYLSAQVASRSLTPQPGMTPDAILSRMEEHLRHGELQGALDEAENLPSEATAAMSTWLASARLRLAAETGAAALTGSMPAASDSDPATGTAPTPAPAPAAD